MTIVRQRSRCETVSFHRLLAIKLLQVPVSLLVSYFVMDRQTMLCLYRLVENVSTETAVFVRVLDHYKTGTTFRYAEKTSRSEHRERAIVLI